MPKRMSMSEWGRLVNKYDALINQAKHALDLHQKNRETAERRGRCAWTPERGGWRCTADAASVHDHRYNEDELPSGWEHGR